MKRLSLMGMALLLCINLFMISVSAAEPTQAVEQINYDDGTSLTITTTIYPNYTRASTRYATKEYAYTDAAGDLAFIYTLKGWFSYDGQTSSATSASAAVDIYKRGWSVTSHSEHCSGNTAYGSVTLKGPTGYWSIDATLTCDRNGNID